MISSPVWAVLMRTNALTALVFSAYSLIRVGGGELPKPLLGHYYIFAYFCCGIVGGICGILTAGIHSPEAGDPDRAGRLQVALTISGLMGFLMNLICIALLEYYGIGVVNLRDHLKNSWDLGVAGVIWVALIQGLNREFEFKVVSILLPLVTGGVCGVNRNPFGVGAMAIFAWKTWQAPNYVQVIVNPADQKKLVEDIDLGMLTTTLTSLMIIDIINQFDPLASQSNVYLKYFHEQTGVKWW